MSKASETIERALEKYRLIAQRRNSAHRTTIDASIGICAVGGLILTAGIVCASTAGALPLVLAALGPYAISTGSVASATSFFSAVGMKIAKYKKDKKLCKDIQAEMKGMLDRKMQDLDPVTQKLFESVVVKKPDEISKEDVSALLNIFNISLIDDSEESLSEFLDKANEQLREKYSAIGSVDEKSKIEAMMIFINYLHASHVAKNVKNFILSSNDVGTEIEQMIENLETKPHNVPIHEEDRTSN